MPEPAIPDDRHGPPFAPVTPDASVPVRFPGLSELNVIESGATVVPAVAPSIAVV